MKYLNGFLLMMSVLLNTLFIGLFALDKAEVNRRYVFDIDKVRQSYADDADYFYRKGCLAGTKYPPEYREAVGFNNNSAPIWCGEHLEEDRWEIHENVVKLGRE